MKGMKGPSGPGWKVPALDDLPAVIPRAAYAELAKANAGRIEEAAKALPGAPALEFERFFEKISEPDPGPHGLFAALQTVDLNVYDATETPAPNDVRVMWSVSFDIPFGGGHDRPVSYGHTSSFPEACELWVWTGEPDATADAATAEAAATGGGADAAAPAGPTGGDGYAAPAGWTRVHKATPGIVNLGG